MVQRLIYVGVGSADTETYFTSPYTAIAKAQFERGIESVDEDLVRVLKQDEDDTPCAHRVIKGFVRDFVNYVHSSTHRHGLVLLEREACLYDVLHEGRRVVKMLVLFVPSVMSGRKDYAALRFFDDDDELATQTLRMLFSEYSAVDTV